MGATGNNVKDQITKLSSDLSKVVTSLTKVESQVNELNELAKLRKSRFEGRENWLRWASKWALGCVVAAMAFAGFVIWRGDSWWQGLEALCLAGMATVLCGVLIRLIFSPR